MANIASLLSVVAEPERAALIFPGAAAASISFRDLEDLSSRLAEAFHTNGLRENDRVAILAPVSIHLYAGLIALFKLGATAVFLDPQSGVRQLVLPIASIELKGLICTPKLLVLRHFSSALRRIPHVFVTEGGSPRSLRYMPRSHPPRTGAAAAGDETPALISFTGGSTDPAGPRGVVRTHHLLMAQHAALSRSMPVRPDDIDLTAFPVVVLHNLASGITSVKPDFPFGRPDEVRPERILQQIDACRITTASGPPAYWSAIAKYCLAMHRTLPLRRIIAGGAVSAPALIRELSQIAPYAAVLSIYGSTEAEPVAIISADEYLENVTAQAGDGAGIPLGRPIPEIDVRILDRDGADCGADRVGEIWVSGDHVARNYSSNPAAQSTEKRLDGADRLWHRMGDVGHRDKTGMLWLAGRVDTTVMRDGREIHPVPVETVAATLPYVARAALIGVPDAQSGERCVLFVEVASDASRPDDWRDQLRGLCAQHKWIIDEIRPIRRLPVDARHHSRIDYRRLKSLATR